MFQDLDPARLTQHFRRLEESLLQPGMRKSAEVLSLLADEFIEFGCSGRIYTKAEVIETLQAETSSAQAMQDFSVQMLAAEAALVTYIIRREASPPVYTLRSSVWQLQENRWLMVFHQGTLTSQPA